MRPRMFYLIKIKNLFAEKNCFFSNMTFFYGFLLFFYEAWMKRILSLKETDPDPKNWIFY